MSENLEGTRKRERKKGEKNEKEKGIKQCEEKKHPPYKLSRELCFRTQRLGGLENG